MIFMLDRIWLAVYEGDGDPPPATPPVVPPATPPVNDDAPTISQKRLNAILADERKKSAKQTQDIVTQLEQLKKTSALTSQEKTDLENRIEELNNSLLTKDELTKKEKDKLINDSKKKEDSLTSERDTWKDRYTTAVIVRAITDGAVAAEAFSPKQIVGLIKGQARLVEEIDQDGKPTGEFITKIKFTDVDDKGKTVILDLTIDEAIKRMKETPEEYGNLFKSTLAGGLGGNGGAGGGRKGAKNSLEDLSKLSTEEYRKRRKELGLGRKT